MENTIFIGQLIEQKRKELKLSKVELAKRVNNSRNTIMNITNRKSIQVELLHQISVAMNYDFFQHYCIVKNETIVKNMNAEIDRHKKEIADLRQQLEQANKSIAEKNFAIDILRGK